MPRHPSVTVGTTQWTFADARGPAPSPRPATTPPNTRTAPTRAARPQRIERPRDSGLIAWIARAIKRYREGRRIDEFWRRQIELRGNCSTPRCPWPRAVTDKCTRCESDAHNDKHNPVTVTGKHLCVDGNERALDAGGNCDGPCPTSLAGWRSTHKPASDS